MTSPTKNSKQHLSNFLFNRNYKTCRILRGFEQLSSSIGWRKVLQKKWRVR